MPALFITVWANKRSRIRKLSIMNLAKDYGATAAADRVICQYYGSASFNLDKRLPTFFKAAANDFLFVIQRVVTFSLSVAR